ncbi:MAG: carboxypeptidase-like regulatory domain-containing protein, partial [Cytophagales bacterium]|nr:carboxypeptidase-like regulatory domain-containing protein [Cytophagales bacterium]
MRLKVLRQIVTMSKFAFYALLLQCVFAGIILASDVRSQDLSIEEIYISVTLENATLKDVFKKLENQTGFNFSYNQGVIDLSEKVSVSANESLGDLLRYLAQETKLNFKRIDNNIFVSKGKIRQTRVTETINTSQLLQGRTVTGKVTDTEDASALPGVNVIVKGTSQGTVTDIDGNYSLNVPGEATVLVFSSVGYVQEEIVVGSQTIIDLSMVLDVTSLEEIVVVGYGTQRKVDLTGSVGVATAED